MEESLKTCAQSNAASLVDDNDNCEHVNNHLSDSSLLQPPLANHVPTFKENTLRKFPSMKSVRRARVKLYQRENSFRNKYSRMFNSFGGVDCSTNSSVNEDMFLNRSVPCILNSFYDDEDDEMKSKPEDGSEYDVKMNVCDDQQAPLSTGRLTPSEISPSIAFSTPLKTPSLFCFTPVKTSPDSCNAPNAIPVNVCPASPSTASKDGDDGEELSSISPPTGVSLSFVCRSSETTSDVAQCDFPDSSSISGFTLSRDTSPESAYDKSTDTTPNTNSTNLDSSGDTAYQASAEISPEFSN